MIAGASAETDDGGRAPLRTRGRRAPAAAPAPLLPEVLLPGRGGGGREGRPPGGGQEEDLLAGGAEDVRGPRRPGGVREVRSGLRAGKGVSATASGAVEKE